MWPFQLVPSSGTLENDLYKKKMPAWPVCPAGWQSCRHIGSSGSSILVVESAWRNSCLLGLLHHQVSTWARNWFPRLAHTGSLPSWPFAEEKEAGLRVYLNNKAWVVCKPAFIDPWADCPLEKLVWLCGSSWWNLQVSDVPQCNTGCQLFLVSAPSLYKHVGGMLK